jgi:hypothetical protein
MKVTTTLAGVETQTTSLEKFWEAQLPKVSSWEIAVGYICEESLDRLKTIAENYPELQITLLIGVHCQDGFTPHQWSRVLVLDAQKNAQVNLITSPINWHGKIFLAKGKTSIATIGSSNLSGLLYLLTALATKHFSNVETLETRRMDSLDFHDVAVWEIKAALEAAFEAGKKAAGNGTILRGSGAAKGRETCSRGKNPVLKA